MSATVNVDDTIAAIATAAGGAIRGMIRISGPDAIRCAAKVFQASDTRSLDALREPTAVTGEVTFDDVGRTGPAELYVWPDQRSYTQQPVVEIHTLGVPPLLHGLLDRLCQQGARLAEPGEFTLRAFLAGRLDLTQAEAVLGVIDAHGESQLQGALSQLAGGLATPLAALRSQLLELLAHLEAGLDFVEEDIRFIEPEDLDAQLASGAETLDAIAAQLEQRAEPVDAVQVVLLGSPNAGKSSLFNALVRRLAPHGPQAIVHETAGTTRDYLVAEVKLEGVALRLVDTAGMAASAIDGIDASAQSTASLRRDEADLPLLCVDGSRPLSSFDRQLLDQSLATNPPALIIRTKADLAPDEAEYALAAISVSSLSGDGIERLLREIAQRVDALAHDRGPGVSATAARCRESLRLAAASLASARELAQAEAGEELVAAELRAALDGLGAVVGAVYTDDILDRVFSRFCIGK